MALAVVSILPVIQDNHDSLTTLMPKVSEKALQRDVISYRILSSYYYHPVLRSYTRIAHPVPGRNRFEHHQCEC